MKKITLTFIAAMICVMATAQTPQQVEDLKAGISSYRRIVTERVYSLVDYTHDREDVVDDIEDIFDDIEDYVEKSIKRMSISSSVSKSIAIDEFYCVKTPTTLNVKYGDFSFFSTPVTYEYHDGDIEVRTTPTTQRVSTPSFLYESAPTRSTFRIFGDKPAGDTVSVKEGENIRYSVTINAPEYDSTNNSYVYIKNRRNGVVAYQGDSSFVYKRFNIGKERDRDNRKRHNDFSLNSDDNTYFYVGFNNFLNEDDEIDNPEETFMELNSSRSIELGFYTTIHRWRLNRFMAMDLGFDYRLRHYSFEHSFSLVKDNGVITADYTMPEGVKEYKRHNLRQQYISIPFTMEFRLGRRDNPLILSAGLEGSIRIASREKQVYKIDDERKVERHRSDFETNFLRYATTFGVGYRRFEVYTNYSMIGLFKENRGPELYPISIGVRFLID
ncbi:MAG: outer membrane beta-barrel protein [Bacteroidales bacterium]|nr:outer membrane beta-barrel protein [Bacteroidales bacterium]